MRYALLALLLVLPVFGQTFPDSDLRGFGKISGSESKSTIDGQVGSVLTINCKDADHAKMVLAKYLSDTQLLPGTSKQSLNIGQWGPGFFRMGGTPVNAFQVEDQGWLSAVRVGTKVLIVASGTPETLVKQLDGALAGPHDPPVSEAEVKVPMWLDRWDQHGFRFYYSPWATPQGWFVQGQEAKAYDYRGDATFAKDHGVGMVYWENLSHVFGADGQTDRTFWDWDEKWAQQDNLATAINLSALNYDIPVWLGNRFRDWMQQPMPDYLGDSMDPAGWRGTSGKVGELAYGDTPALDAEMSALQQDVRHFASHPNVVSWLEPHGELAQGGDDWMGYGPATDKTFRAYLQKHYGSADEVAKAWGQPGVFTNWDAIHCPEIAEFCGWDGTAFDLAGQWRVNFFDKQPLSPDWVTPAFNDSTWLTVTAPGDDRNFTLAKQPAVYRRSFDLPADWTQKHPRSWVYLWDTNIQHADVPVQINLNGKLAGESKITPPVNHWMTAEVTSLLQPGSNQVSLVIPDGYIGYRVYLSGTEPKQYPGLGAGLNQKWVDLVGWRQAVRVDSVRRGMEMIREVDPNRGITLMAPGYAADGVKTLAQDYGGEFHDTGFMAGVWADLLPSLMRGSDLPFSVEPGGPATDAAGFKRMMGFYATEAINEVSYFIHIGDVMWHPDIRKAFEEELPMIHMFGKYHEEDADVAFLWSTEVGALSGFPWSNDLNANLPSGWNWRGPTEGILGYCQRDGISESDFKNGYASKYKVIIDTNTSIMDQATIDAIEKYVSDGGTFITMIHTGRHSPTQAEAWPIQQLTGYKVLTIEKYTPDFRGIHFADMNAPGAGSNTQTLNFAPGQTIYSKRTDWMDSPFITGLRMQKVKDDAQDILTWKDGTVAAGMRKIGKGQIIEFGCKSDSGGGTAVDWYKPIFEWLKVKTNRVSATLEGKPDAHNLGDYFVREYESNNGLYNIAVFFNGTGAEEKLDVAFADKPAVARDVQTDDKTPVADGKLTITLAPLQLKMIMTPRNTLAQAGSDWLGLQRKWWRATKPISRPFPKMDERFVRPLDSGWDFHPLAEKEEPNFTSDWDAKKQIDLGAWNADPELKNIHHAELRRSFTVPAEWNNGTVRLWIATAGYPSFSDEGRVFLDGKALNGFGAESGVSGSDVGGALAAGSKHVLTVEARGKGQLTGLIGSAWIIYVPKPVSTIDLAGQWTTCKDDLFHDTGTVTLPGPYEAHSLWRTINLPADTAGKTIMLVQDMDRPFQAYVNGVMVSYGGTPSSNSHLELNITPFLHPGQDNRIQLVSMYNKGNIGRFALDLYEPGTYP